jgi:hypothetical protein
MMMNIRLYMILLFIPGVNADTFGTDTSKLPIKAVEVRNTDPMFGPSISRIYYIGSFVIYEREHNFDSAIVRTEIDEEGEQDSMTTESAQHEKRNHFFVFHRDSSFGINYDAHGTFRHNRRYPVDSILFEVTGSNTFDQLVTQKTADTSSWNADRTELKEVYAHKSRKDTPAVRISF